jgi:hypothetical protein
MPRRSHLAVVRSGGVFVTILVAGALMMGCSPAAAPSLTAVPSLPAASQLASAAAIVLERTGPIGCDSIGIDYTSATIRIDPASDPAVWAETNTGKKLTVKWTAGFGATDGAAPVIRGPQGEEVARDGTKVEASAASNLALAGYFVCFGPDAMSVLETPPQ